MTEGPLPRRVAFASAAPALAGVLAGELGVLGAP